MPDSISRFLATHTDSTAEEIEQQGRAFAAEIEPPEQADQRE